MNNFYLIILDGVGIGELPDASQYNDAGCNTLKHISQRVSLKLPNLQKLGLGNIEDLVGITSIEKPLASFGKLKELSKGKDSTTGHWELSGIKVNIEFSYFPMGFPDEIITRFIKKTGVKGILGNKAISGTEIINEFGDEHIRTGYPIIYTSADSVFQIAAHEEIIPLKQLYKICEITRHQVLGTPLVIGRVIARPFAGKSGKYKRTKARKDFSIDPPDKTILDILFENKINTIGIGKINDLFNNRGIKYRRKTESNSDGCKELLEAAAKFSDSFIFANLVDFDMYYGHRNDVKGFAKALKEFDDFLPEFMNKLDSSDAFIITSDHGNDPTTPGTDHTREYVPLIFYYSKHNPENLGIRYTFSDVGKTVSEFYKISNNLNGISFL